MNLSQNNGTQTIEHRVKKHTTQGVFHLLLLFF